MKISFTDRELGIIALALTKCDVMSDMGVLPKPWCNDHNDEETMWMLEKIEKMREG